MLLSLLLFLWLMWMEVQCAFPRTGVTEVVLGFDSHQSWPSSWPSFECPGVWLTGSASVPMAIWTQGLDPGSQGCAGHGLVLQTSLTTMCSPIGQPSPLPSWVLNCCDMGLSLIVALRGRFFMLMWHYFFCGLKYFGSKGWLCLYFALIKSFYKI